jgi:hypothetical protein
MNKILRNGALSSLVCTIECHLAIFVAVVEKYSKRPQIKTIVNTD